MNAIDTAKAWEAGKIRACSEDITAIAQALLKAVEALKRIDETVGPSANECVGIAHQALADIKGDSDAL